MNQPSSTSSGSTPPTAPPTALVRSAEPTLVRLRTRLWWLTALCLLLALGLVVTSFRRQGVEISVGFKEGHGLKVGDALRYRGIDIGRVSRIALSPDLAGVQVNIVVQPGSELVAVEGSQFWIQRARLSLSQISGIETVLGAKYVGVLPGQSDKPQRRFEGVETPLVMTEGDGTEVRIRFASGQGLEVGQAVRYRGVKVGEVTLVELSPDLQSIDVAVRLVGSAGQLARQGAQFWIERPRLDLTEVRGLETLLSGLYIAIEPGSRDAPPSDSFVGLVEAPPLPRRVGSLEIELDAPQRLGIVRGTPIMYRGLEVGRVAHVGLSQDGASVKFTAVVDTDYVELVREDSKWWVIRGASFRAGLTGIELSIDSLSAWLRGGIAFATPPNPGKPVVTGHRFVLESEPQSQWLTWQPRIATGMAGRSAGGLPFPTPVRVVASWKVSVLGFPRRQTEKCWGLVLDDGFLAIPQAFIEAANAAGSEVRLEIAGQSFPYQSDRASLQGSVGRYPLPEAVIEDRWPHDRILPAWNRGMLLVVNPELSEPLAIDATRVEPMPGGGLKIAPGVSISAQLSGSPVVDSDSGQVYGLLARAPSGWVIGSLAGTNQAP